MRRSYKCKNNYFVGGFEELIEIFGVNDDNDMICEEKVYYQTNIRKEYYDPKVYGRTDAKYFRDLQEERIEYRKEMCEESVKNCNMIDRLAKEESLSYGEYVAKMYLEEYKKAEKILKEIDDMKDEEKKNMMSVLKK